MHAAGLSARRLMYDWALLRARESWARLPVRA
jgi:hypothetical protein